MNDAALRPGISLEHFKNERDYIAQRRPSDDSTVAAMDWARAEIERQQAALQASESLKRGYFDEIERQQAELRRIAEMCPATAELTLAHEMADIAMAALAGKEGP